MNGDIIFTAEVWVPVLGFEDLYYISDHGRVWSTPRPRTRGGILKPTLNQDGYLKVQLGRGNHRTVHSLVAEAFLGPRPSDREVCHDDGTRTNNYWENLYYGTDSDNALDSVAQGTNAKLKMDSCPQGHEYTEKDVRKSDDGSTTWRRCGRCHRDQERERKARTKT